MRLSMPYEELRRRFPMEVAAVMAKLRAGKSKERLRDASELTWEFSWSQQVFMYSFQEAFGKNPRKNKTFLELFPEANRENVRFFLGDSIVWGIAGKIGRWSGEAFPPKGVQVFIPIEILDLYVDMYNQQIAEQARIAALTPKEKEKEVAELIKKLSRSPGFVTMKI